MQGDKHTSPFLMLDYAMPQHFMPNEAQSPKGVGAHPHAGFETVTLCYLDNTLVKKELLTAEEVAWYNAYQERVYQTLSPDLTAEEASWLRAKTLPL